MQKAEQANERLQQALASLQEKHTELQAKLSRAEEVLHCCSLLVSLLMACSVTLPLDARHVAPPDSVLVVLRTNSGLRCARSP